MNPIQQLQNDWANLAKLLQDDKLGWAPTSINPVSFTCESQIVTQQALQESLSSRADLEGWVVFPDEVLIWNNSLPDKPQPPLSGELGSPHIGLRFDHLGSGNWRLTHWSLNDTRADQATHITEPVIHEPAAPANRPLGYQRIWQVPTDSDKVGLPEPIAAVFTGFKEASA